jgi:hypothetical protein
MQEEGMSATFKKALTPQADAFAVELAAEPSRRWDDLREWIDMKTGGDLDCNPLDILTDMVATRLLRMKGPPKMTPEGAAE